MRGERYQAQAAKFFAHVERSADPRGAAREMLEQLEVVAAGAEAWQANEEEFLAQAVELMRRADHARQAAGRASAARARIERERQREKERLRKNARARARYRERRLTEPPRFNQRTGMHALAIEVDPTAYAAVKAEAFRRRRAIPTVIGEILSDGSWTTSRSPVPTSRWRRTGEGRRAKQHTRIDVDDETWRAAHIEALGAARTIARWIGMALESWAQRQDVDEVPHA